ncbi:MAG: riboflavin biosynthesis protein RibF [Muribaculaceae bacterium]|nr:riboflavin biosynthesis protein RibF [Muribaculaceae bacterium]
MQIITSDSSHQANKGFLATVGVFDGVHKGHVYLISQLLKNARRLDLSPLIITFNELPENVLAGEIKQFQLLSVSEKLEKLERAGAENCLLLDFTLELSQLSSREFMSLMNNQFGVKGFYAGYNHNFGNKKSSNETLEDAANSLGLQLVRGEEFSDVTGNRRFSSTTIRNSLLNNNIKEATSLLGYHYEIAGTVIHGQQRGRTIGFPTANIMPDSHLKLIPKNGVYACRAFINDFISPAMVNIGYNPTAGLLEKPSIEAHILDLPKDTDLYGTEIKVQFFDFLRKEKKFPNFEELREQILRDRQMTLEIMSQP